MCKNRRRSWIPVPCTQNKISSRPSPTVHLSQKPFLQRLQSLPSLQAHRPRRGGLHDVRCPERPSPHNGDLHPCNSVLHHLQLRQSVRAHLALIPVPCMPNFPDAKLCSTRPWAADDRSHPCTVPKISHRVRIPVRARGSSPPAGARAAGSSAPSRRAAPNSASRHVARGRAGAARTRARPVDESACQRETGGRPRTQAGAVPPPTRSRSRGT